MKSLVGREGIVTKNPNYCLYIIEIDGEEFDVYSVTHLPDGATIVVKKARLICLDVEMKASDQIVITDRGS